MRKNAPRKWIHAILDLLPLLIIPIFAIYSQRHEINDNSVTINKEVPQYLNFKQDIINGLPIDNNGDIDNWVFEDTGDYYIERIVDDGVDEDYLCVEIYYDTDCSLNWFSGDLNYNTNDIIYFSFITFYNGALYENTWDIGITTNNDDEYYYTYQLRSNDYLYTYYDTFVIEQDTTSLNIGSGFYFEQYGGSSFVYLYFKNCMLFNLTQIYGSGNEPTASDFNTWLNGRYLPYGDNYIEIGSTTETITYNDTDIGSQFIYQMYNVTDKYFNFNNLFNMQGIYDWLQLNLFGGNAPLPVTIVWNIIVYEFFIDLIFLLYSVLMFVIDFAQNTLDRFLNKSKGGW